MNQANLVGNVGRDPELRSTPSGAALAKFSVATTRRWRDRDGNKAEATEWHNCIAWGKLAEAVIGPYVKKGTRVRVTGRLQTDSWEDKQTGKKMYRTEIVVAELDLLGSPSGNRGGHGGHDSQRSEPRGGQAPPSSYGPGDDDGDIPF